ncbi:MAG: hypothetical protein MZU91_05320 [Desulfosudis oleivorans]|nr:hypothetical protein [Desulfosudis oleivorans]
MTEQDDEDGGASHVGDIDGQERQDERRPSMPAPPVPGVRGAPGSKEAHGPVDDEEIETRDIEEQLLSLQLNALLKVIPARLSADELRRLYPELGEPTRRDENVPDGEEKNGIVRISTLSAEDGSGRSPGGRRYRRRDRKRGRCGAR